jgi:S-DNA-T family DNA segregation ATPase FtsK/SpoIIIE
MIDPRTGISERWLASVIPDRVQLWLSERLREAGIVAWLVLALALLFALLSYDPQAASWNVAVAGGPPVATSTLAVLTDLLVQSLGVAAMGLPLCLLLRGLCQIGPVARLLGHRSRRTHLWLLGVALALPCLAMGLGALSGPTPWALERSAGGLIGKLASMHAPAGLAGTAMLTALTLIGAALLWWAQALRWHGVALILIGGYRVGRAASGSAAQAFTRISALIPAKNDHRAPAGIYRAGPRLAPQFALDRLTAAPFGPPVDASASGLPLDPSEPPPLGAPVIPVQTDRESAQAMADDHNGNWDAEAADADGQDQDNQADWTLDLNDQDDGIRADPPFAADPSPFTWQENETPAHAASWPAPMAQDTANIEPAAPKPIPVVETLVPVMQLRLDGVADGDHNTDHDSDYVFPAMGLLATSDPTQAARHDPELLRETAAQLESVLNDFNVRGEIVEVRPGPVVTLFELEPAPGTKSSRVIGLADDLARSMAAISVRVAVVPGRSVIGIELPNKNRDTVYLREALESQAFTDTKAKLPMALGKDIGGQPVIADLAKMPHLLVAGTTGSGKSVGVNAMIVSLLYHLPPEKCRFIFIDPKMLELSVYNGIPHLLTPVVTEPGKAVVALKWAVREMEDRYRAMSITGVRNIDGYNTRIREAIARGEAMSRKVQTGFDPDTGKPVYEEVPLDMAELPYIVVVVDEMADLMLVAGKDIEATIQRLAQMARAAGIHLIMATQRPSVDVITGTIKANFPTRISFSVTSKIDSRTILGEQGAEQLLGMGDMLHMAGGGRITRVHGPFVADGEVEAVVNHLKTQGEPIYLDAVTEDDQEGRFDDEGTADGAGGKRNSGDTLYDQAVDLVARERKASTSFIQRHLQIGYNRAARLIERMEKDGVISNANQVGKREVLVRDNREDF